MGWLPIIPDEMELVRCHICHKLVQAPHEASIYYIVWTPDDECPEEAPLNCYYVCSEHLQAAMKTNTTNIKVKPAKAGFFTKSLDSIKSANPFSNVPLLGGRR